MPPLPPARPELTGRPAVVGLVPGQPDHIAHTAIEWAVATGARALYFAYVDQERYVVSELDDGAVRHADLDPDSYDETWAERERALAEYLERTLGPSGVPWRLRYLAGRPDQALSRLAEIIDAAVLIVGTRRPTLRDEMRELLEGSVAVRLAHHQRRPILVVPLTAEDWDRSAA